MLDVLTTGFQKAKEKLTGHTALDETNVADALDLVRSSLLDADVEYNVAKNFLARIKNKAIGQEVKLRSGKGRERVRVTPADHFIRICQSELEALMGPSNCQLEFPRHSPAVIMMVGLQGTGKTTTTGKLANYLRTKHKRKPLLVAADVYRPAAREQLRVLGDRIDVPVFSQDSKDAVAICKAALEETFALGCNTVLIDTAGRLTIDTDLMTELQRIKEQVKPSDIVLVCDAMMGQDAVTTAVSFHKTLTLSGAIMTKLDGDARGGAALSIKEVTGVPIKFLGMGEGLDQLEEFRPQGLAGRILGLGDVVGLMQDFERVADKDREEDAMRMMQGKFNLKDFSEQVSMMQKMGSMRDLVDKIPGSKNIIPPGANIDDQEFARIKIMISSMTEKERLLPDIIAPSRVQRIAAGSGRSPNEINNLLSKFKNMRKIMGNVGRNMGLAGKVPGVSQLAQMKRMKELSSDPERLGELLGNPNHMRNMMRPQPAPKPAKAVDRDKLKKLRRAAKTSRRKNRKK